MQDNDRVKPIYIEEIFKSKSPKIARLIPGFAYSLLKRLIHQDGINAALVIRIILGLCIHIEGLHELKEQFKLRNILVGTLQFAGVHTELQDGFIAELNRSIQIVDVGLVSVEQLSGNLLIIIDDRNPLINQLNDFLLQFFVLAKDTIQERLQQNSGFLLEHGGIELIASFLPLSARAFFATSG